MHYHFSDYSLDALQASNMNWRFLWLVLTFFSSSFVHCFDNYATDSLNAYVEDFAFKTLVRHRPHTGALYKAILPANLSGMEVSIVRLRSRRLWNRGANFSNFHIPSRTMPMPHVRRVAVVYQDLGNWSSQYYPVPGYSLITSVVGFMVFDASNVNSRRILKLGLSTMGKRILIHFPNLTFPDGMISRTRCVAFAANGTVYLSEMRLPNVCFSQDEGHFSVVVPMEKKQKQKQKQKQRDAQLWAIGFVLGFIVLVLVGYMGTVYMKLLKTKKIQVMEKQADEGLVFETKYVGSSKMPSATVTRTQPVLENGGFP